MTYNRRVEHLRAAYQRFVDALNHARDEAVLRRAVTDDVRIDRHAPAPEGEAGPVAETFEGFAAAAKWVLRTPAVVTFALAGEPRADGAIAYALEAEDFKNGGVWRARLADDGRIAFLAHQPFALRED